ncbi:hypothetical protein GLOTRDRAFT_69997 [Gloeophyllum trabeum ATCC 11539]|uniref:Cytochrome c oxidase assembly factor 3 n=1 Tax=Gloeophyllum trabeum (strain ATCC 11539 / FP-39264 / Madison 617) TaxID=670483 RepID=S7RVV3_GLOTA|nr:uncharacterized protein GLOTRDRAFT_69997 [Gloeophyllum trabeum ATCC 11539]EPQ58950.1 hypothetical protein GLOTRDRAFT_69997 [Gloeophyllum trabeum ATCC 11539]
MADPYINRREAERSYRPKGYGMSPGLKRARAPYRVRNAVTGVLIGAFAVGVWAYSLRAVNQDVFDDVDEQAKALAEERARSAREAPPVVTVEDGPIQPVPAHPATHAPRGILAKALYYHFPSLLDPRTKTLVWGAPPVDRVGRVGDPLSKIL